jgi:hypothetical protein
VLLDTVIINVNVKRILRYILYFTSKRDSGAHPAPSQWVPGAPSPGVKRQGREADNSPPSIAEVETGGAIHPRLHDVVLN